MKKLSSFLVLPVLLALPGAATAQYSYGWTISSSVTDPFVNTGAVGGTISLYLWQVCQQGPSPNPPGASGAEFNLAAPLGATVLGFTPAGPCVVNSGDAQHLVLSFCECLTSAAVVGHWTVVNPGQGSYCLVPGPPPQPFGTLDCLPGAPQTWPITQVGFGAGVPPACNDDLCPTPVSIDDGSGWGSTKALYR